MTLEFSKKKKKKNLLQIPEGKTRTRSADHEIEKPELLFL